MNKQITVAHTYHIMQAYSSYYLKDWITGIYMYI